MQKNNNLKWCFGLKDGLKLIEPNNDLAKAYISEAKKSLERAQKDFNEKDLLWSTVKLYYAEYYALYSFLQKIGVKCENHTCSILAASFLLGEEKTKTINLHKEKRIDAQYYIKIEQEPIVSSMLKEGKAFISGFDELISNLTIEEIESYRKKLLESVTLKK